MWVAKKDFPFRKKNYKKGEEVRVSDSLASELEADGKITKAKATKAKAE